MAPEAFISHQIPIRSISRRECILFWMDKLSTITTAYFWGFDKNMTAKDPCRGGRKKKDPGNTLSSKNSKGRKNLYFQLKHSCTCWQ